MTKRHKGSLTLDWINKDMSLYYEIDEEEGVGVRPQWVPKNDIKVSEPRLLNFVKNYGDEDNENLLIRGDNLLVLRTLVEQFKSRKEKDKVKLIYIDPPYNTGYAFERYDDNLKHSEWLTMMRDRLFLLKKLMKKEGIICVQIDSQELCYLKILMDEVFGRNNLISLITLKVKDAAGVGTESPIFDICEYILIYSKDFQSAKKFVVDNSYEYNEITEPVGGYNRILVDYGKSNLVKKINRQNVGEIKIFKCQDYDIKKVKDISFKDYVKHFEDIFVDYNPSGGMILAIKDKIPEKGLSYIEYVPTKGRDKGKLTKVYFHNRRILAWLRNIVLKEGNVLKRKSKITNLWNINTASLSNEGSVYFPQSKKPENLIKKIIEMTTVKGDLVLDSFAGSGTTGAVAHKMERNWIMIELGDHAEDLCFKRLKNVVDGKDASGITTEIEWKGGGGFKYYKLGESLIKDKNINWNLKQKEVAESLFYIKNFKLIEDKELIKKEIFIGQNQNEEAVFALCIVSKEIGFIKAREYFDLVDSLQEQYKFDLLYIYTNKGVNVRKADREDNVKIRKIPQTILKKFGLV